MLLSNFAFKFNLRRYTTVRTQRGIHNKVMSLGYDQQKAEIKSVDSLHSLGGSVVVMVAGALSNTKAGAHTRPLFSST
jgi:hypothetical protein